MRNKIMLRLTLYFTAVLLVFGLIIGGAFYGFFKEHTLELRKREMNALAARLSAVITDNHLALESFYGDGITDSRFLGYLDNTTTDFVWMVDEDRGLIVNQDIRRHRYSEASGSYDGKERNKADARQRRQPPPEPPKDPYEAYQRLPEHIKKCVEEAFDRKRFTVEEYNTLLEDYMLTVGVPVYDGEDNVRAVLLLHSPVRGMQQASLAGLKILGISLSLALVLGLGLSLLLSLRFTRPLKIMRDMAEQLGKRNYEARNGLAMDDEIGELAKTLDVLAERLKLADAESKRLEALRQDFIANTSHELRTPVTIILGSLEVLRDGIVTSKEETDSYYARMQKEALFLKRSINDLLDLSRLQDPGFQINCELLDFCDVIKDSVRGAGQLLPEKKIQISMELDRDFYLVRGDYERLKQLLLIFLHNALKFSPEQGSILVKLANRQLQIIDHGCGMKEEDVAHAFERFYKAGKDYNREGTGLGLSIAQQIAERHGFKLAIQSKEGCGTTISIEIPEALKVEELQDE